MSDYTHGTMPIVGQDKTYKGFLRVSAFFTAFLIVILLMPILVFAAHMAWLPALIITFILGVIITPAFKLGGGWIATLVGLSALAAIIGMMFSVLS